MSAPDLLLGLAPARLPLRREGRFAGDAPAATLADLAAEDRALAATVYRAAQGLWELRGWVGGSHAPAALAFYARTLTTPAFAASARALGRATAARGADPAVLRAVRDLRGGALPTLMGYAAALRADAPDPAQAEACAALARDHARLMRAAVADLDPFLRAADARDGPLAARDLAPPEGAVWRGPDGGRATLRVHLLYGGAVARCPLEAAALGRVLYCHLNDAARCAADGFARLTAFAPDGRSVRWVVENRVGEGPRARLPKPRAGAPARGLGLDTCAEMMALCYGLAGPQEAVEGGYLGAKREGDRYFAWFHWPAGPDAGGARAGRPGRKRPRRG